MKKLHGHEDVNIRNINFHSNLKTNKLTNIQ